MQYPHVIKESNIEHLSLLHRGKVRDIYEVDKTHLLIVTSDRLSAFDVVLPDPIPDKGKILTELTNFWFDKTQHIIANHLSNMPLDTVLPQNETWHAIKERSSIVDKFNPLPIEAIVRGYLIGSGWRDYQENGSIGGLNLPTGLALAQKLPEVIFTPSTKENAIGAHDQNISIKKMQDLIGCDLTQQIQDISIKLYQEAVSYAIKRGVIIADTKFEFGTDTHGKLFLIDEILTPDSSRFWYADQYIQGENPPSFDKQYVRDYLETLDWDKTDPGPSLPPKVIQQTRAKYLEIRDKLLDK